MISCPKCGRHHKIDETACPFCRSKSSARGVIGLAVTTVLTPVVLAACYGVPNPCHESYKCLELDTGGSIIAEDHDSDDTGFETDADGTPPDDGTGDSDDTGSSGDSDDTGSSGDSDDTGSSGDSGDTGSPTEEDISTAESTVPMDVDFPECATDDDLAAR